MRFEITTLVLTSFALGTMLPALEAQDRPFAGFNPGRCVMATRIIEGMGRRLTPDTVVYRPSTDTLLTRTADSIALCAAAFGGTTEVSTEMLNLARVQLVTGRDSAAGITTQQHLVHFARRPPAERAWELRLVVIDNLAARPARLARAKEALRTLDRMGTPAAAMRLQAHNAMAGAALAQYDDPAALAETQAAIAAWKELSEEGRLWHASGLAGAFLVRAQIQALSKGGDAARAVIDTARGMIPVRAEMERMAIERAARMYSIVGKPAAPLEAQFWFNVGAEGSDRAHHGRVSLVVAIDRPCTGPCRSLVRTMRRFAQRFHSRGLEITFLTQTFGFYLDTAPASPLEEARYDSSSFLGELDLPGALAVAETKYSWKADGRRINTPTPNQLNYPGATLTIVLSTSRGSFATWRPRGRARSRNDMRHSSSSSSRGMGRAAGPVPSTASFKIEMNTCDGIEADG
jgi:hypothetical protein